ncbi:hypothetical protein LBC_00330 [Campylobacter sp. 19-13652]|nr:hypothetical protein LBC_00330 [Campylobacter sp. 19-13652]
MPYTVSPLYIAQDTTNSPTSTFTMAKEVRWFRQLNYANMLDELKYCPTKASKSRVKRGLPEDFQLNEGWLGRLWQINISRSSDAPHAFVGLCGICMLHSAQMVSELLSYQEPRSGGGYLFDTAGEVDPFISFQSRYPYMAPALRNIFDEISWLNYGEGDEFIARIVPPLLSTAGMLLPNYTLHPSPMVRGDMALDLVGQLFGARAGTLWLAFMYRTAPDGSMPAGHSEPLLLTAEGLVTMPTNRVMSLEEFRDATRPMRTARDLIDYYTGNGILRLGMLMFVRVAEIDNNLLDLRISPRNCTGEGEQRRGNAMPINPGSLNQCSGAYGGRCM